MTYLGIDTAARISAPVAAKIAEQNLTFVGRYLTDPSWWKSLTDDEVKRIHNAGVGILLIWETTAARCKDGEEAGKRDGYTAYSLAKQIGVPDNMVIYFAVDYDAPKNDYAAIEAYLYAAKAACAPYRCGVYGKADLINAVKADAYMQCVAWSYGVVSTKTNVYQYEWQGGAEAQDIQRKTGVPVDMDRCDSMESAGVWLPEKKKMWYDDAMAWAEQHGLIKDGRPNDPVTRAELATVLYRIFAPEDPKENSGLLS